MADDVNDKPKAPVMPLGAQVMRSLHRGIKGIIDQHTEMSGPLDDCGAKSEIGNAIGSLGELHGGLAKAWAKHYKDHDLDAEDPAPEETKAEDLDSEKPKEGDAEGSELSDDDIDAALAALDDDAGEDEGDADKEKPKPTEKSEPVDEDDDEQMVMKKRQLESRIKRLERLAAAE